jgi:Leucine-rich repeat (LRR) protein
MKNITLKLKFKKPIAVHHHMLMGLGEPPKGELNGAERGIELKYLDCGSNFLSNLNELGPGNHKKAPNGLNKLEEVLCDGNRIRIVPDFLVGYRNLQNVSLVDNPIKNNEALDTLLNLIHNRQHTNVKVYTDRQNVHNSSIVRAIRSSIDNLMKEEIIPEAIGF